MLSLKTHFDNREYKAVLWILMVVLFKISICALLFYLFFCVYKFIFDGDKIDYLFVFFIGILLSAIELGSRYKDEPVSVMVCIPGAIYLIINGLICCVGLFFIHTFGIKENITEQIGGSANTELSNQVANVLYASLGSFFVMRSSFLKLGTENSQSQIDLGLNLIVKKMIDMIDRQVDRDQARRRSKDITEILRDVSYEALSSRVHPFCLQVMQNVPEEELGRLFKELQAINSSDDCDDSKKMAVGLQIYNIVGSNLFSSIVDDLGVVGKAPPSVPVLIPETPKSEFEEYFGPLVVEAQENVQSP